MTTSVPAHDRWVCATCRWTAKHPVVDVRADDRPSYRCPHCRTTMVWAGTAFRPPRRTDDAGWETVAGVLAAGGRYRSTRSRQRMPRTPKELAAWLARPPTGWRPEQVAVLEADAAGVVERVRVGSRLLEVGELARCWHDGRWVDTVVRWTGDGNRPLPAPVLVPVVLSEVVRGRPQATGYAPGPAIPVESGTSLRLLADDD